MKKSIGARIFFIGVPAAISAAVPAMFSITTGVVVFALVLAGGWVITQPMPERD